MYICTFLGTGDRVDVIVPFLYIIWALTVIFAIFTSTLLGITVTPSLETYAVSFRAFAPWARAVLHLCS